MGGVDTPKPGFAVVRRSIRTHTTGSRGAALQLLPAPRERVHARHEIVANLYLRVRREDRADRPRSGRRSFRVFRDDGKQHGGRPQRADQYAEAQRYDDAELVLARRFRDHHVWNRAVHREELSESL